MMEGNICAQKYALCHLCWCWVNKLEMLQRTAEEACLADHSQEELASFFIRREDEARVAGLELRRKPAGSGGIKKILAPASNTNAPDRTRKRAAGAGKN